MKNLENLYLLKENKKFIKRNENWEKGRNPKNQAHLRNILKESTTIERRVKKYKFTSFKGVQKCINLS